MQSNASIAPFSPLTNARRMAELISDTTGAPVDEALRRLRDELADPGGSIARDVQARRLTPYVWSDELIHFYGDTDGFLYELALWNRNKIKRRMRKWLRRFLDRSFRRKLDVLGYGDGLGFDCLDLHREGHRASYFELPGLTQRFAQRLFEKSGADISVLTDPGALLKDSYDVVSCLDVLEHVPDPEGMVRSIVELLRPDGLLVVHAPFYMIHPYYATHLRSNRRFAGDMKLYTRAGLELINGQPGWNPLVFRRVGSDAAERAGVATLTAIRATGAVLSLGRCGLLPLSLIHYLRRRNNQWFDG